MAHKREEDDRGPLRLCVVTRETAPPQEMLRFVVGPDTQLVADLRRNLPGRGVWVKLSAAHVRQAIKRKAFARSLKQTVQVSDDLPEQISAQLRKDAVQALSFANKAGAAVSGYFKVESALKTGRVAVVLHAREAAPDGVRKLRQAIRRTAEAGARDVLVIDEFDSSDLSLALGGEHVIHAALEAGPATTGFLTRWARFNAFRDAPVHSAQPQIQQPGDDQPD